MIFSETSVIQLLNTRAVTVAPPDDCFSSADVALQRLVSHSADYYSYRKNKKRGGDDAAKSHDHERARLEDSHADRRPGCRQPHGGTGHLGFAKSFGVSRTAREWLEHSQPQVT
jgi:hypothetical protein